MVHIDYNHAVIRDINGEYGDKFRCSLCIFELSPETAYAYNLNRKPTPEFHQEVERKLKEMGVKRVIGHFPTGWVSEGFDPLPGTDLHIRYI